VTGRWPSGARTRTVVLGVLAVAVLAGAMVAAAGAQSGDAGSATASDTAATASDATAVTERVADLEALSDKTLLQYGGGLGLGLGLGACVGAVAMYKRQAKRIEDTFQ
jgi:hypothetical protein